MLLSTRFSSVFPAHSGKRAEKEKQPPLRDGCHGLVIFANLVTNCAGCFASRLAGCLAFTAATFFYSTL